MFYLSCLVNMFMRDISHFKQIKSFLAPARTGMIKLTVVLMCFDHRLEGVDQGFYLVSSKGVMYF